MNIKKIIIHCAATPNGKRIGHDPAQVIDRWHKEAGFRRQDAWIAKYNSNCKYIGYHWVIDVDGVAYPGRYYAERGAHTKGHNEGSIGICLVGTDKFTLEQWEKLQQFVEGFELSFPGATIHGHNEFSNKICPGFNVADWEVNLKPLQNHLCASVTSNDFIPGFDYVLDDAEDDPQDT